MKTNQLCAGIGALLITLTWSLTTARSSAADDINTLFQQGKTAYYDGNFTLVKTLLSQVHALSPNHLQTNAMLAQIAAQTKNGEGDLRKLYSTVIIPKLTVNDATLQESLEALAMLSKKASDGKVEPNFVVRTPALNKSPITVNLNNVPLTEAVRYLAELSKAKITWDKHAVMFSGAAD